MHIIPCNGHKMGTKILKFVPMDFRHIQLIIYLHEPVSKKFKTIILL